MSRISFTETEKSEWVGLFENYDLSAAAFCREFSLPYASFLSWRREFSALPLHSSSAVSVMPKFVELVPDPGTMGSREWRADSKQRDGERRGCAGMVGDVLAELELGTGYVLRVYRPTSRPGAPQV